MAVRVADERPVADRRTPVGRTADESILGPGAVRQAIDLVTESGLFTSPVSMRTITNGRVLSLSQTTRSRRWTTCMRAKLA
jgi:hypothetical protein